MTYTLADGAMNGNAHLESPELKRDRMPMSSSMKMSAGRTGKALWRYGVPALLAVACSALVLWIARTVREQRAQTSAEHGMIHMMLGLRNYCDQHGRLPASASTDPSGDPKASWRFFIMPFVEKPAVLTDWDGAWDDPRNQHYARLRNRVYCYAAGTDEQRALHTNVLGITGAGTAFDPVERRRKHLEDLPADLIVAAEVRRSGLHWMQPGDFELRDGKLYLQGERVRTLKGSTDSGVHVAFADGAIWLLSNETPLEVLSDFMSVESVARNDREQRLRRYLVKSSQAFRSR